MRVFKVKKGELTYDKIINDDGVEFLFCSYGASIIQIKVGEDYLLRTTENSNDFKRPECYYGKTIGRLANRMRGHKFTLNNKEYELIPNEGENVLHGGINGLSNQEFKSAIEYYDGYVALAYQYLSQNGEGGYPGSLLTKVTYYVYSKGIAYDIKYEAKALSTTPCSLTNHAYFTLGSKDISDLSLQINSSYFLDVDKDMIATEKKVINRCMDFRKLKRISRDIDHPSINRDRLKGYDHFFYFDKADMKLANVILKNRKYEMKIYTDFEGAQIYTSNFGEKYLLSPSCTQFRDAVAIEPGDSHLYLRVLKKGQVYRRIIKFRISEVKKEDMDKNVVKNEFKDIYQEEADNLFSCGGRIEILGNHTDHNHGKCLAATCDLHILAAVKKKPNSFNVVLKSKGYPEMDVVDLRVLEPLEIEKASSKGLIRGIAEYLKTHGYKIGGFEAYSESSIFSGAGVSSSAAFELLIGQIFNELYNNGEIPTLFLCKAGQYAENKYFGKASGLLDQIGVAYGDLVAIDFENIYRPEIEHIPFGFEDLHFVIINTGGSHAHLSHLYSQIPEDMYSAAKKSGVNFLRETTLEKLNVKELSDIEYSRALHFYEENERVAKAIEAVKNGDKETFLQMVNGSRISSTKNLKNMMVEDQYKGSPLEACDLFMEVTGGKGAIRINGGGFAGSVIAVVPDELLDVVLNKMGAKYGDENVKEVHLRHTGPIKE